MKPTLLLILLITSQLRVGNGLKPGRASPVPEDVNIKVGVNVNTGEVGMLRNQTLCLGQDCDTDKDCCPSNPQCMTHIVPSVCGNPKDTEGQNTKCYNDDCSSDEDCCTNAPICFNWSTANPPRKVCNFEGHFCNSEKDCFPDAPFCNVDPGDPPFIGGICEEFELTCIDDDCSSDEDCCGKSPICFNWSTANPPRKLCNEECHYCNSEKDCCPSHPNCVKWREDMGRICSKNPHQDGNYHHAHPNQTKITSQ